LSVVFVQGTTDSNPLGGWKVQAYNGRRMRNRFFSRKIPNSAAAKYIRFVRENHALVKPKRGIGIHGFNLSIMVKNREEEQYYCGFVVMPDEGYQKRFIIRAPDYPFSLVFRQAIDFWAESHQIREKDKQRVLVNAPGPECFKNLRRQMNKEGYNIPVSAISDAFWEQRNDLSLKRIEEKHKAPNLAPDMAEIAQWFEAHIKTGEIA